MGLWQVVRLVTMNDATKKTIHPQVHLCNDLLHKHSIPSMYMLICRGDYQNTMEPLILLPTLQNVDNLL